MPFTKIYSTFYMFLGYTVFLTERETQIRETNKIAELADAVSIGSLTNVIVHYDSSETLYSLCYRRSTECNKFYPKSGSNIRPHQKIQSVYQTKQRRTKKKMVLLLRQCVSGHFY